MSMSSSYVKIVLLIMYYITFVLTQNSHINVLQCVTYDDLQLLTMIHTIIIQHNQCHLDTDSREFVFQNYRRLGGCYNINSYVPVVYVEFTYFGDWEPMQLYEDGGYVFTT